MIFYSSMAPVYDKVFPLNPAQVKFTLDDLDSFGSEKTMLDVGCATGNLVMEMQKHNIDARGIDLDEEMIEIANRRWVGSDRLFNVRNMLDLESEYSENSFHLLTCYGNTIVHLNSEREIQHFFSSVYKILKNKGHFLGQIINYDRILDQSIDFLPTIDNPHIQFKRNYTFKSNNTRIDFNTELHIKETEQVLNNSVELLPLRKRQLEACLYKAGFDNLQFWGGFNKCSLDNHAQALVFRARKN